ncbi:hypothetical protein Aduo_018507 [Ancylostoma duodenale]
MAACVYLVCEGSSALVIAKSKLPSIKDNPTIPKLEINALTMATRLVNTVFHAIRSKVSISAIMISSDSELSLSWLANPHPDQKAGVLVRNRTAEIRRIADDLKRTGPLVKFGYVKTDLNPADCATRGLTRDDLNEHLWWTGPDFLVKEQQAWPQCHELVIVETHEDILPNLTPCVCAAAQVQHTDKEEPIDWTRHSSMSRAVSAFAYALRWFHMLIERVNPDLQSRLLERFPTLHTRYDDNFITVQERRDAMKILIRCHQRVHVANGINYSKDRLFPVTDHDGLIRCRGRLQQSDLSETGKSPLLLGANTPLAALVIREAHRPHHLATAHTMARDIVDHTGEVPEQTVEVPEHTEELPQNDTLLLDVDTEPSNNVSERRYHLRNRPRPNYGQLNRGLILTMLYLCCLANLCGTLSAQLVESPVRLDLAMASGSFQCTTEGILIETNQIDSYELCAEDFCVVRGNSPQKEMIHLPPEITLHVHTVHLKVSYQGKMKILDTQCPAIPFCDRVECWFCTANLFNPECNPRAVIITIAIILYGIVAILYTFCYVPVVVGLPIRVVFIIATTKLQIAGKLAYSCYRSMRKTVRQRADGRRSTTGFVPLILVILAVHLAQACQNVDVFEMRATTCVKSSDENETFDMTRHTPQRFDITLPDTLLQVQCSGVFKL